MGGCVWLFLQAQKGDIYFTEMAERVEYGKYVGGAQTMVAQTVVMGIPCPDYIHTHISIYIYIYVITLLLILILLLYYIIIIHIYIYTYTYIYIIYTHVYTCTYIYIYIYNVSGVRFCVRWFPLSANIGVPCNYYDYYYHYCIYIYI